MAKVKPFKGIRPKKEFVQEVASLPYDVMSREEAKEMAKDNPWSFLHVVRSEIDLDDSVDIHSEEVYKTARKNLDKFIKEQVLNQDEKDNFYIYRQIMNGRVQTGLVACTSIDDYENNIIKKHEFTRPEKEQDRINNFDYCDANTAPIFLSYRKNDKINTIINDWIKFHMPVYNFKSDDGVTHIVWVVDDENKVEKLSNLFDRVKYLYIADGHHRTASSYKVGLKRRESNPDYTGEEEFNYFMSVIFPDDDLFIMDYNRVVKDLNGNSVEEFLSKVEEKFKIDKYRHNAPYKPLKKHTFGMYLGDEWYKLTAKEGTFDSEDPVESLDASILQSNLLKPILGVEDPRTSDKIDFVGGIRGLKELEKRVDEEMKVAFSMYPVTIKDLMKVADTGNVMPPKSTWFEPKLRSGLFVHKLS